MQRDMHDLLWGAFLALLGLGVAFYAAIHYDFGTPRQMGPGFFPVGLGMVLAGLGLTISISAWWRSAGAKPFAWRALLAISVALLFFGLTLDRIGLIIATAVTVLIASSVAPKRGMVWRLVLTVLITLLTWAIFILALRMTMPVWPRGL